MWNGFSGIVGGAVDLRQVFLQGIDPLLVSRDLLLLLFQEWPKLGQSLTDNFLQLWRDGLPLLVLRRGRALTVPRREVVNSLEVEERFETRNVVINQSEVLVMDGTAYLWEKGGGRERERERGKRRGRMRGREEREVQLEWIDH